MVSMLVDGHGFHEVRCRYGPTWRVERRRVTGHHYRALPRALHLPGLSHVLTVQPRSASIEGRKVEGRWSLSG